MVSEVDACSRMTKTYEFLPTASTRALGCDQPTALGPRASALLLKLVERAGHLVGKELLIETGWPGLVVEESNLTVPNLRAQRTPSGRGRRPATDAKSTLAAATTARPTSAAAR